MFLLCQIQRIVTIGRTIVLLICTFSQQTLKKYFRNKYLPLIWSNDVSDQTLYVSYYPADEHEN